MCCLYELDGLDWFCVRPSGTEPKIKIYFGCYRMMPPLQTLRSHGA
jgi:phosphomannomutase